MATMGAPSRVPLSPSRLFLLCVLFLVLLLPLSSSDDPLTATRVRGRPSASSPPSSAASSSRRRPFPLLVPDDVHQKLVISPEGLEVISRVRTAVSPVVVIGPYRSGKSFLLNQMLGLKCDEGFGVGHLRAAQTKGVWIWGEPLEVTGPDGKPLSIFFMDTEGFDSTGKTDVYDDRIFAFSALVSSVLVYNLPETVKEGDIEKLAFAVELADEFQGRAGRAQGAARGATGNNDGAHGGGGGDVKSSVFRLPHLLWLIQRDFLQGQSVGAMLEGALQPVPNAGGDHHVERLNSVRGALRSYAQNYSAFGLVQPHLDRTRLCDLPDSELDPGYVCVFVCVCVCVCEWCLCSVWVSMGSAGHR